MTLRADSPTNVFNMFDPSDPNVKRDKAQPPRGRPPLNYVWVAENDSHGYVHSETGEAYDKDLHKGVLRARKAANERRRYWDPNENVRKRRMMRCQNAPAKDQLRRPLDEWSASGSSQLARVQTTKE